MLEYNLVIFLLNLLVVCSASVVAVTMGSHALVALMSLFIVCANLMVSKSISLLGFHITATDALAVGTGLTLNLLREYFSTEESKRAITISFFCSVVYLLLTQIHLAYQPTAFDTCDPHYQALLGVMPRLIAASLIAYIVSQRVELALYSSLKRMLDGRYFVLRNYISLGISQSVDTLLFSFIGLYGSVTSITDIIIFCYLAKVITIALSAPLIALIRRFVIQTT